MPRSDLRRPTFGNVSFCQRLVWLSERCVCACCVWQLQTLPEDALAYFVTAQCLPDDSNNNDLAAWAERFHRLLYVYRQCRHAFHAFAANIEGIGPHSDGSPVILTALSSERWPTFREMFPGACGCQRIACDRLRAKRG